MTQKTQEPVDTQGLDRRVLIREWLLARQSGNGAVPDLPSDVLAELGDVLAELEAELGDIEVDGNGRPKIKRWVLIR